MFKLKMRLFTIVIMVLFTLQAFPVYATAVTQNSFAIKYEDVYMFSIYRHYKGLYAEYDNMAFIKAINALPLLQKASELSEEKLTAVYSTYCGDERTHVYQIRSNELRCDDIAYVLTSQQYNTLKQAIDQTTPDSKSVYYPIWLGYINPARVASMTFTETVRHHERHY